MEEKRKGVRAEEGGGKKKKSKQCACVFCEEQKKGRGDFPPSTRAQSGEKGGEQEAMLNAAPCHPFPCHKKKERGKKAIERRCAELNDFHSSSPGNTGHRKHASRP